MRLANLTESTCQSVVRGWIHELQAALLSRLIEAQLFDVLLYGDILTRSEGGKRTLVLWSQVERRDVVCLLLFFDHNEFLPADPTCLLV